jgi:hypothetical protein
MVKQTTKDNKRRLKSTREAARPTPNAKWVQAFMIMLLHKVGGKLTLSFDDLKRFEGLAGDNMTSLDFDDVARTVTIRAPEYKLPDKKKIITPNKKIIVNSERG